MDTDSLVVSGEGYKRLSATGFRFDPKRLGALKIEHVCSLFHALSPKCYILGERVGEKMMWSAKSKGVDLRLIQNDEEKLREYFTGACKKGDLQIAQTRFVRKAGYVDIQNFMKTQIAKRKNTQILKNGWVLPANNIADYSKEARSIGSIFYCI